MFLVGGPLLSSADAVSSMRADRRYPSAVRASLLTFPKWLDEQRACVLAWAKRSSGLSSSTSTPARRCRSASAPASGISHRSRSRWRARICAWSLRPAARGGQTLAMVPALVALLDEGIARGEGGLDVAAGGRVPGW